MKATEDRNVSQRGKHGVHYVRHRIPRGLLTAYPRGKREIVRSLRTADPRKACSKAILALAAIKGEFRAKRAQIDVSCASEHSLSVRKLTDEQLARHRGEPVELRPDAAAATHPFYIVAPHLSPTTRSTSSWSDVFIASFE